MDHVAPGGWRMDTGVYKTGLWCFVDTQCSVIQCQRIMHLDTHFEWALGEKVSVSSRQASSSAWLEKVWNWSGGELFPKPALLPPYPCWLAHPQANKLTRHPFCPSPPATTQTKSILLRFFNLRSIFYFSLQLSSLLSLPWNRAVEAVVGLPNVRGQWQRVKLELRPT